MIADAARRLSTVQLASIIVTVIVDKVLAAVLVQGYDVILAPTWGGAKANRAIFCVDPVARATWS